MSPIVPHARTTFNYSTLETKIIFKVRIFWLLLYDGYYLFFGFLKLEKEKSYKSFRKLCKKIQIIRIFNSVFVLISETKYIANKNNWIL